MGIADSVLTLYLTGAVLAMIRVWGYGMDLMQEQIDPGLSRVPEDRCAENYLALESMCCTSTYNSGHDE